VNGKCEKGVEKEEKGLKGGIVPRGKMRESALGRGSGNRFLSSFFFRHETRGDTGEILG